MTDRPLAILQVNTSDSMGGAARVAADLASCYRSRGQTAWMAVGQKETHDPDVFVIPNSGPGGLIRSIGKAIDYQLGVEDFRFPATHRLLELTPRRPDLVHLHNLHGGYFDLRVLAQLSRQVPVVLTLHDAWLLSGHCAHSMGCDRWRIGCGACPDLTLYPAVRRDATAHNWRRKRSIYRHSALSVAAPSRWLMAKVDESMLKPAAIERRVIPNGIDLSTFCPADRAGARSELGLAPKSRIALFSAQAPSRNIWKDYGAVRSAIQAAGDELHDREVVLIVLGDEGGDERIGQARVISVPYQRDPGRVARYYQAADVYLHAARADTFPTSVIEALACGVPVVATAVGGIPEQVDHGETGLLVPAADRRALADALVRLLTDDDLRRRMSTRAATTARPRFDLQRQADTYLAWYRELVESRLAGLPA